MSKRKKNKIKLLMVYKIVISLSLRCSHEEEKGKLEAISFNHGLLADETP